MLRYLCLFLIVFGTTLTADHPERDRGRDAAVGAVAGALLGAVVDGERGAIIGGLGGATVGAMIGDQRRAIRHHTIRGATLGGLSGYGVSSLANRNRAAGTAFGAGIGALGGAHYAYRKERHREVERVPAPRPYIPPIPVRERDGAYHATQEYWNLTPTQRAAFRAHLAESGIRIHE